MFDFQENIVLPDAQMVFIQSLFDPSVSDQILSDLTEHIAWQQGEILMFGKRICEPRLTAWYGDSGKTYTYSGKKQEPLAWNEPLLFIKQEIEKCLQQSSMDCLNLKHPPPR